ncbi:hypothetical protein HYN69_13715 [Gemmobacter aquarius]|uniref:Uncharacterized protein n=2 Tax=Paragemmobacter aquarius TaxID=2169400 RepID=A0A2S0UNM8_9RHOB|nr:hypothetical protein HYN69_13715 [Gemmobacter aquarius]
MPDFLPDVPVDAVLAALARSPGNELASGKFDSPESSAALAVNAFGRFLDAPALLPALPAVPMSRPEQVALSVEMHFPWRGGRHPWCDVALTSATSFVGICARRYEPFRPAKANRFAEPFDSLDWGEGMARFEALRAALTRGALTYRHLDAVQLVKLAYGLRTQAHKRARGAVLVYLHAAPATWASGKPVDPASIARHGAEVEDLARRIKGQDVAFVPLRWSDLLAQWAATPALAPHAKALQTRFGPF